MAQSQAQEGAAASGEGAAGGGEGAAGGGAGAAASTGAGAGLGAGPAAATVARRVTVVPQPACLIRALPVASSLSQWTARSATVAVMRISPKSDR